MLARNIAHQAVLAGHSVLFVTAAQLLLAAARGRDRQASTPDQEGRLTPLSAPTRCSVPRDLRVFSPSGAVLADLEMPVRMMSLRREGSRLVALPSYLAPANPPLVVDVDHPRVVARLEGHTGRLPPMITYGRGPSSAALASLSLWMG